MPAFAVYDALMDALIATVREVWPDVKKVHLGWPTIPPADWPYAVIALPEDEDLKQTSASVTGYWQIPKITITWRSKLPPANEGRQRVQIAKANALIAALEASSTYPQPNPVVQDTLGNIGPLPSPMTLEGKGANHFLEVNVVFTCRVLEHHHSRQ